MPLRSGRGGGVVAAAVELPAARLTERLEETDRGAHARLLAAPPGLVSTDR
ncbi:hypothetical protein [Streptomyces paradoxus]|uniref:hypothetical protein n=1 Tax=Streptomyces paradoxus TaxID=66375 RepID=UPI00382EC600